VADYRSLPVNLLYIIFILICNTQKLYSDKQKPFTVKSIAKTFYKKIFFQQITCFTS